MEASQQLDNIPPSLLTPIREALDNQNGGEVVVRRGGLCGRIFVCKGKIAWVTCSSIPRRLREVLVEEAKLTEQDLSAVLEESKRTGVGFAETLLGWDLVDQVTLNRCLRLHNARHFQGIMALGSKMNAMFIPQPIHYAAEFLYTLDEILSTFQQVPVQNTAEIKATVRLSRTLEQMAKSITGTRFVAIAQCKTHKLLVRWPPEHEPEDLRQSLAAIWNGLNHNTSLQRLDQVLGNHSNNNSNMLIIGSDSLVSVQRLGENHFILLHCDGLNNMGLTLSKSQAYQAELLKNVEP